MMQTIRSQLKELFEQLNTRIKELSTERKEGGLTPLAKAKVTLLGQVSLLANEEVSAILALAQTGDLDALISMDEVVKLELKKLLNERGLIYDEDSYLIWIPPGAKFEILFNLEHVLVESVDAESALVSKAIKAPEKNKQLIRQAIVSDAFPTLVDRILAGGGKLERFT